MRPGLGTWDLLADLEATMAAGQLTTLAIDDIGRAFDAIPIAPPTEAFAQDLHDPRLLSGDVAAPPATVETGG